MRRITIDTAEELALKMRVRLRIGASEPVNMKTVLRQLNILTVYRPLTDGLWGLSLKSSSGKMFMLVSSNATRGSQHFTIAHELFHLFYDEMPRPHFCGNDKGQWRTDPVERSANLFASAFLMPKDGLAYNIPTGELKAKSISIDTALRLEQLYGVSHATLILRLYELKFISNENRQQLIDLSIRNEALLRGIDPALYYKGNENLIIGDYGEKAKNLFDKELISEGHYMELMRKIGYGKSENHS